MPFQIYLASRSPRRAELLTRIGVSFRPLDVEIDERPWPGETPESHVRRIALAKGRAGCACLADRGAAVSAAAAPRPIAAPGQVPDAAAPRPIQVPTLAPGQAPSMVPSAARLPEVPLVLAADTSVVADGLALGKPRDRADAAAMLRRLSGRAHQVLTAVALFAPDPGTGAMREDLELSVSTVRFRDLDAAEIDAYWDSGEPADKAGGYGIQGRGALFVAHLDGSHSGVMGLPLFETGRLLARAGLDPVAGRAAADRSRTAAASGEAVAARLPSEIRHP